ncbi:MAG: thioredoxin family protein [Kiritimatiellae bacterium]|nr:thioredoxin family protein [Kiritimatiellia bacterium]
MKQLLFSIMFTFVALMLGAVEYPTPGASVPKGFVDDFKKACEDAKATDRFVFVCFSGSDWCGWCVKLEKEVFSAGKTEGEFAERLKDDYVLVFIDLPMKRELLSPLAKEQNEPLVKEYNVKGFPTALIIDPAKNKVVEKTGYRRGGIDGYVEYLLNVHRNADKIAERNAALEKYVRPIDHRVEAIFNDLNQRCGEYIDAELGKEGNTKTREELKEECFKFVPEVIPELEKIIAEFKAAEIPDIVKADVARKLENIAGYLEYIKKQSENVNAK